MREFGYIKLTTYFYFISILIGLVVDSPLLYNIVFFVSSFILFFIIQTFFYNEEKVNVKSYVEMTFISLKDIGLISLYFLLANLLVQGTIFIATYLIADAKVMEFASIGNAVSLLFIFAIVLLLSNFTYYHTYYKKIVSLSDKSETDVQPNHITMKSKK